mmetsp:Transcript_47514/g.75135  ORF Transcript_47514/g.75135 Transcript_47514/m.75135 type:complete len:562 (-) Transcript_47514:313-1998(-)
MSEQLQLGDECFYVLLCHKITFLSELPRSASTGVVCHWYASVDGGLPSYFSSNPFAGSSPGTSIVLGWCAFLLAEVGRKVNLQLTIADLNGEHIGVYEGSVQELVHVANWLAPRRITLRNVLGEVASISLHAGGQPRWTLIEPMRCTYFVRRSRCDFVDEGLDEQADHILHYLNENSTLLRRFPGKLPSSPGESPARATSVDVHDPAFCTEACLQDVFKLKCGKLSRFPRDERRWDSKACSKTSSPAIAAAPNVLEFNTSSVSAHTLDRRSEMSKGYAWNSNSSAGKENHHCNSDEGALRIGMKPVPANTSQSLRKTIRCARQSRSSTPRRDARRVTRSRSNTSAAVDPAEPVTNAVLELHESTSEKPSKRRVSSRRSKAHLKDQQTKHAIARSFELDDSKEPVPPWEEKLQKNATSPPRHSGKKKERVCTRDCARGAPLPPWEDSAEGCSRNDEIVDSKREGMLGEMVSDDLSFTFKDGAIPSEGNRFRVVAMNGVGVRMGPDVRSPRTGKVLKCGDVFEACASHMGTDGRTYLKLVDAVGWAFDDSNVEPHDPSVQLVT